MQSKLSSLIAILCALCSFIPCHGQSSEPAALDEQLRAQYQMIQACGGNGTLLVVQKTGIVGVPVAAPNILTSKYQNGVLHPPFISKIPNLGTFLRGSQLPQQATQQFSTGLRVYPSSMQVNMGKDGITMTILACDLGFKANILFQFPKGALQKLSIPEVVDTISQVLAFDQPPDSPAPQAGSAAVADQSPAAPENPPEQTQTIKIGATINEVEAALGEPAKKIDLGDKQIFIYKDVKLTFKDGKVVDAE